MAVKRKKAVRVAPIEIADKALEAVLGKAVLDPKFRKQLFKNPEKVKKTYNLTAAEMKALGRIKPAHLETFADTLRAKLLKSASVTIFCAATRRE